MNSIKVFYGSYKALLWTGSYPLLVSLCAKEPLNKSVSDGFRAISESARPRDELFGVIDAPEGEISTIFVYNLVVSHTQDATWVCMRPRNLRASTRLAKPNKVNSCVKAQ